MEMKNSMGNDLLGLGSNLIQDIEVEEDRTKEDEFRDKLISAAHNYGVNDAEYMVTAYSIIDERRKEKDERKRELDKLKYVMYIGLFIVVCSVLSGIGRVFGGSVGINLLFGFLLTALGALYKIGIGNNVDDVHLDRRWKYRKYYRK